MVWAMSRSTETAEREANSHGSKNQCKHLLLFLMCLDWINIMDQIMLRATPIRK